MDATLNRYFARCCAGTLFHTSKYLLAASMASIACSFDASWNTPITSEGREGFVDFLFPVVITFFPPIHMGYSRPNSPFTFASACSIFFRFAAVEKSINGSFVNVFTFSFAFPVAMASLPPGYKHSIIGPLPQPEQATPHFWRLSRKRVIITSHAAIAGSCHIAGP